MIFDAKKVSDITIKNSKDSQDKLRKTYKVLNNEILKRAKCGYSNICLNLTNFYSEESKAEIAEHYNNLGFSTKLIYTNRIGFSVEPSQIEGIQINWSDK